MNPTTIEWVLNPDGTQGSTSNPFTGCLGPKGDGINCPYCYAKKLANGRLKPLYLSNFNIAGDQSFLKENVIEHLHDPFYPRLWPERLQDLDVKSPKGIFVCDMSDWAAPWLPMAWKEDLMAAIRRNPQHRIYLLTHQPQELPTWTPFPENCWVGVTATNYDEYIKALIGLFQIEAKVKYISFEPLVEHIIPQTYAFYNHGINWLIIGACTGKYTEMVHLSRQTRQQQDFEHIKQFGNKWTLQPDREWVAELIYAADKAQIPVFLKNNLKPLFPETFRDREYAAPPFFTPDWDYRQEMPR